VQTIQESDQRVIELVCGRLRPQSWWKFRLGATLLRPEFSGSLCRVPICVKYGQISFFEGTLLSEFSDSLEDILVHLHGALDTQVIE